MNRPLKFRAWCPREGEMYDPFTLQEAILQNDAKWHENDDLLMQFTGLTDKDGKEIYERDVVIQRLPGTGTVVRGEIVFSRGCFVINSGTIPEPIVPETCEILGNICENPELIQNV